jgi:hypothetical protein
MTALERINYNKAEVLYKKIGRKYVTVNDPSVLNGLRDGFWLVKVAPGSTSIRQQVYPYKAEITAAAREKEDELVDIIRKASEARPSRNPLTPEALADWQAFIAKHGKEFNTLEYPSLQENAERIMEALLK